MPLYDMTNSEPACFLSLLANASCDVIDAHDREAKRARTTSPAHSTSSSIGAGAKYLCKQCGRAYANTDAARKHARQNHPEWLKEQGQGSPSLYCTPVEPEVAAPTPPAPAPATVVVTAVPVKPLPLAVSAVPAFAVPPPAPSPAATATAHLLMSAAESCYAASYAAYAPDDELELEHTDDETDKHVSRTTGLATLLAIAPAPAAGWPAGGNVNKRPRAPRTVRCGNCEGCVRDDCGMCKNCVDKPRFGGLGQRKQGCVHKICSRRVLAVP